MDISKTFVNSRSQNNVKSNANVDSMVLHKLSLEIKKGEFFSLLGPSGCGKTTLLRIISGLESPTSGQIELNGRRITDLRAQERPFHMVFQRYALFPHLTVYENVAFGLRLKKLKEDEINSRVFDALELVSMKEFAQRSPETLSGGQQQRVALARALVNRPEILLLDEPLSALDLKLREKMQSELKALQQKTGITFILITHDQGEALALSDRIAVMNRGKIEQVGTPEQIYNNPATLFVADFVGESSFIRENGGLRMIRPENLSLNFDQKSSDEELKYAGIITQTFFRGTEIEISVELSTKESLKFFISGADFRHSNLEKGKLINLAIKKNQSCFFKDAKF